MGTRVPADTSAVYGVQGDTRQEEKQWIHVTLLRTRRIREHLKRHSHQFLLQEENQFRILVVR